MTSKSKKKVDFSVRPRALKEALPPNPDQWVREGRGSDTELYKRLTLNLPAALHTAFKGRCVLESITFQDKVRILIERELASERPATGEGGQPVP
jgi:hypothetical protein